jgi:hypothetical protein
MGLKLLNTAGTLWDLFHDTVTYLLKARTVEPEIQLLQGNGSANTPVAGQWFSSCHMIIAKRHAHSNRRVVGSCFLCSPCRGYIIRASYHYGNLETAVRRAKGWCEMTASLQWREPRSRGSSTVGRHYHAVMWRSWLKTLFFVWEWFVQCSHELF